VDVALSVLYFDAIRCGVARDDPIEIMVRCVPGVTLPGVRIASFGTKASSARKLRR